MSVTPLNGSALAQEYQRWGISPSRTVLPQRAGTLNETVFSYCCNTFAHISPAIWAQRFEDGLVYGASGEPFMLDAPFISGLAVFYYRHIADEPPLPYVESVLFQDDLIVVADKPHFLPVTPSGNTVRETLLARLRAKHGLPDLTPVHRIDRDTAGVVVFCVQPRHRGAYQNLFRDGLVQKRYQAIAPYIGLNAPMCVSLCLKDAPATVPSFMQTRVVEGLANSYTDIVAIDPIVEPMLDPFVEPMVGSQGLALYELAPSTGKRHQLRAHMSHIGAPIVGDQIYPVLMPQRDITQGGHAPLQLLAKTIAFTDPVSGLSRAFSSNRSLKLEP